MDKGVIMLIDQLKNMIPYFLSWKIIFIYIYLYMYRHTLT
jgi:hypothetical protein